MTQNQQLLLSKEANDRAMETTKQLTAPRVNGGKFSFINLLAITVFGLAFVLILYMFYLFFYPITPLTINSIAVTTPVVKVGGTMVYKIDSCKHVDVTPAVYKKLVSSTSAESLPVAQGVLDRGCSTKLVPVHIPVGTLPGSYELYTDVIYQINALRTAHVIWHTPSFQITN